MKKKRRYKLFIIKMKHNYQIYEDSEEYENEIDFFQKNQNKLKIGDTIEYILLNQKGYKKYKVYF